MKDRWERGAPRLELDAAALSVLLRGEERLPPSFTPQLVSGFRAAGGTFPERWRQIARLLDLINLCDFLTKAPTGSTMARDVARLVMQTVDEWQD